MKEEVVDKLNLPSHVAIIMDGNGRWAKKKGAARIFGHQNAITAVRETTELCAEIGVKHLTLYAFSTENWARPKIEVDGLMTLLVNTINGELPTLMKNKVRLSSIGDIGALPQNAQAKLEEAKNQTANNDGLNLILALNYSGRWEITEAVKKIASACKLGDIDTESINIETINSFLNTKGIPDPELLIRTSGEMRISNFMLWQLAYTEIYITDVLWPDFRKADLLEALKAYQLRERRFGKVTE
jgi:undecaprenyl diphosphate synthase